VQMDDDHIAGKNPQRWRLQAIIGDIAISRRPFTGKRALIPEMKAQFQKSVMTLYFRRICYVRTSDWSRTNWLRLDVLSRAIAQSKYEQKGTNTCADDHPNHEYDSKSRA